MILFLVPKTILESFLPANDNDSDGFIKETLQKTWIHIQRAGSV